MSRWTLNCFWEIDSVWSYTCVWKFLGRLQNVFFPLLLKINPRKWEYSVRKQKDLFNRVERSDSWFGCINQKLRWWPILNLTVVECVDFSRDYCFFDTHSTVYLVNVSFQNILRDNFCSKQDGSHLPKPKCIDCGRGGELLFTGKSLNWC